MSVYINSMNKFFGLWYHHRIYHIAINEGSVTAGATGKVNKRLHKCNELEETL